MANESFARFMATQSSKIAENQEGAKHKTIMPNEFSEESKATPPSKKVRNGKGAEREKIVSSREDVYWEG